MKISDRHLSPEELVDIVEGAAAEASAPHLATCSSCRQQLTDLRAVMSAASDLDVPEPSPAFWSQQSRRIAEAVESEHLSRRAWWLEWARPRVLIPVSAVAVAVLIVTMLPGTRQSNRDQPVVRQSSPVASVAAPNNDRVNDALQSDVLDAGDASLTLVADLTANIDLNGAVDAGLTSRGSAEHAVTHMTTEELRALRRVLKEELARSGA